MAKRCGIEVESLAVYEKARAPLRWKTYRAVASEFPLNPWWLASGLGLPDAGFDRALLDLQIDPKTLFSKAFELHVQAPMLTDAIAASWDEEQVEKAVAHMIEEFDLLASADAERRRKLLSSKRFSAALSELHYTLNRLVDEAREYDPDAQRITAAEARVVRKHAGAENKRAQVEIKEVETRREEKEESVLDVLLRAPHNHDMARNKWELLRQRLRSLTEKWGAKSMLAERMGVSRQIVNAWISGKSMPGADTTLRLLEWVAEAEALQKNAPQEIAAQAGLRPKRKKQQ